MTANLAPPGRIVAKYWCPACESEHVHRRVGQQLGFIDTCRSCPRCGHKRPMLRLS